jgi:hypothetical protein
LHEYWRWPSDGNVINIIKTSHSKLAAGIDVIALNYMVIAPPTVNPKWPDPYSWLNDMPIIEAPDWYVKLAVEAAANGADGGFFTSLGAPAQILSRAGGVCV